jgi:hypothetical protein
VVCHSSTHKTHWQLVVLQAAVGPLLLCPKYNHALPPVISPGSSCAACVSPIDLCSGKGPVQQPPGSVTLLGVRNRRAALSHSPCHMPLQPVVFCSLCFMASFLARHAASSGGWPRRSFDANPALLAV